jgi:hypothetical protein
MPPAALRHVAKPSATSKNFGPKPGAAAAPGSANVARWIVLPTMPRPEPPVPGLARTPF